jgi:hypothetical protein
VNETYSLLRLAIVIMLLATLCSIENVAQPMLVFTKNHYRQAYYYTGDVISFRLKGDKTRHTFQILGIEDSVFLVRNYRINPVEISHIYVDDKTRLWYILRYKYEKLFLAAGAGYLGADVLNTGELKSDALMISSTLICTGLIARWVIPDRMKIRKQRKLFIVQSLP